MIRLKSRRYILFLAFIVILTALNTGVLTGIGISETHLKIFGEFFALLIFIFALKINISDRKAIVYAMFFISPLAICALSGFITGIIAPDGYKGGIIFARWIMSYALFGIALFLIAPSQKEIHLITIIITGLLLFQPVIAIIKLIVFGLGETPWIGTMHQSAGQLGLLIPLIAISFFLPRFLCKNHNLSWMLILPFIFFSIAYEKRAAFYLLPFWLIMIYTVYAFLRIKLKIFPKLTKTTLISEIKKLMGVIILIIISVTFIPFFNPTFHPGEKIERITSYKYITKYTHDYLIRDYDHPMNISEFNDVDNNQKIQLGRFKAIFEIWKLIKNQTPEKMLFGLGGGYINSSHLLGENRSDIMYSRIGIRSSISAASTLVIEGGIFGLLLATIWFFAINIIIIRIVWTSSSVNSVINSLSILFFFAVAAFDFFIYSSVIWTAGILSPLLFAVIGSKIGRWRKNSVLNQPGIEPLKNIDAIA